MHHRIDWSPRCAVLFDCHDNSGRGGNPRQGDLRERDPRSDRERTKFIVAVAEDERCGESYATISAPNGDFHFFAPDWSASPHFFADRHQPTCVLRIRPGQNSFDEQLLELSALGSGSAAAGAAPDGADGFPFATVDPDLWEFCESNGNSYWRFRHDNLSTKQFRQVSSLPIWAGHPY